MQLPDFLKPFLDAANKAIKDKLVKDIEFSGGTYQVQIVEPKSHKAVWAFLQLDPRGLIKDCFCSCEEAEEFSPCLHLAIAYLKIYNGHLEPLHIRFERSLWNRLCYLFSEKFGVDASRFKYQGRGLYVFKSLSRKEVFTAKGKTAKAVSHLKSNH